MISVIVPVYNSYRYLPKCVDSIMNQTYKDFELILVDDGSADESPYLCDEYARQSKQIRVIHKTNGGAASARNLALDNAKGEFILFVDADDHIPDNHLSVLLDSLEKECADLAIASVSYIPGPTVSHKYMVADRAELLKTMMYRDGIGDYPVSKLYRAELFKGVRYREGLPGEDFDVFYELFSKVSKAVITDETTYYYVQHRSSVSNKDFNTAVFGRIDTCKRLEESVGSEGLVKPMMACLTDEAINIFTVTPPKYKEQRNWAKDIIEKYGRQVLSDPSATKKLKNKIKIFKISPSLWILRMKLKHLYIKIKE